MRLERMHISGFRSFGERTTIEFGDNTVFIGANNAGKTAALAALAKIFSQRRSERQIIRSDFHLKKDESPNEVSELSMSIECVFCFDELAEDKSKSEDEDGAEERAETSAKDETEAGQDTEENIGSDAVPIFFDGMTVNNPNSTPILRVRLEATWSRSSNAEGAIDSRVWFITSPEGEKLENEHRAQAPRQRLDAIRMVYVPAVRDPDAEIKYAAGSVMSSMLGSVKWDSGRRADAIKKVDELSDLLLKQPGALSINNSIESNWKSYNQDDKLSKASLAFIAGDFESIVRNPSIQLSPSFLERPYQANELGDGYKSLFYLTMIHSLISLESKIRAKESEVAEQFQSTLPVLTIVAIEEPENHIAPHLLGHLVKRLDDLWNDDSCQVVITSHSPAVVGRVDPTAIRHFRMETESASSVCTKLTLPENEDEAYKYVKASIKAYPEVLFAKAVVLGEGDSESVVLPRLLEANLGSADSLGVSIAPIGGRHAKHFWRLLNELHIPHVTLLDLDRGRSGGDKDRLSDALEWLKEIGKIEQGEVDKVKEGDVEEQLKYLEKQNVFYSAPLDLDFAMLEAFPDAYKETASRGPQLKTGTSLRVFEKDTNPNYQDSAYVARVNDAYNMVLHSGDGNKGSGDDDSFVYEEEQKRLMPWYQNLFLGERGKPATHRRALLAMDDKQLKDNAPESLTKLVSALEKLLVVKAETS